MDNVSKDTRSRIMSSVRSTGNRTTEIEMVKLLKKHKLTGWRRHLPILGKPDFTWKKEKVILFVDGCFWHGCPICKKTPSSNKDYWANKISKTKERDLRITRELRKSGWKVVRVWECKLMNPSIIKKLKRLLNR